jgi:hypothetical protein
MIGFSSRKGCLVHQQPKRSADHPLVTARQESADYPLAQKELEFSSGRSVKTKDTGVHPER